MTLETLSRWWDPISLKGKLVSHSIRIAICFVIWNYLPNVFDIHNWYHTAIQLALVTAIMPSWCRAIVFALIGIVFNGWLESGKSNGNEDIPHDAIPGDPGPAWSEEWKEPFSWTRFHRD